MKHRPQWVIFDIGNVLFDFKLLANDLSVLFQLEKEALLEQVDKVSQLGFEGQITLEEFWKSVLSAFGLENNLQTVIDIWNTDEHYWVSDTKRLLKQLKNAGYKLAILTNNWGNQTENLWINMSSYVQTKYIFESSVEKLSKPDEKLFKLVENRLKAKGSDILFVDDLEKYLEGAEKLQWQTFQYAIGDDLGKTSNNDLRKLLLD